MDTGQIIILGVLAVLAIPVVVAVLNNSTTLRNALLWFLIFTGATVIAGNWDVVSRSITQPQVVYSGETIEVFKGSDNHFHLTLQINDVPVDFLVDTGATDVVLTQADAARVGLDPKSLAYIGTASTANGTVPIAPVRLETVQLGDILDTRVRASVNGGEMDGSLLGMSYLSRFQSVEIRQDRLILTR